MIILSFVKLTFGIHVLKKIWNKLFRLKFLEQNFYNTLTLWLEEGFQQFQEIKIHNI